MKTSSENINENTAINEINWP